VKDVFKELYQRKASLFLAGHDHHFEQLGPADDEGKPREDGIRSFVVGTGGVKLYSEEYSDVWPFREAYSLHQRGVLKIELKKDRYSWAFLPVVETAPGQKKNSKGGMKVIKNVTSATCNRAKS
jgi:acid phosphatase type 7